MTSGAYAHPALFGLPRLATSFVQTAIVTLTLPALIVEHAAGQEKGLQLGATTATGAALSLVTLYAAGALSDRTRHVVPRKVLPVAGLVMAMPAAAWLAAGAAYHAALVAVLWLMMARSACDGAHISILADQLRHLPPSRFAAFLAFYQFTGSGLGALAFGLQRTAAPSQGGFAWSSPAAMAFAIAIVAAVGFWFAYREDKDTYEPTSATNADDVRRALRGPLAWFLMARTCFLAAALIVTTFLLYFVHDVLAVPAVEATTARLIGCSLAGAVVVALPAGRLSARVGDTAVLFGAGAVMGVVAAIFIPIGRTWPVWTPVLMVAYGAAFGTVVTSGLSLTVRLVPSPALAGRLTAITTGSTYLSQGLASATGAVLLDPLNGVRPLLGYWALVVVLELFLVVGGVCLRRARVPAI